MTNCDKNVALEKMAKERLKAFNTPIEINGKMYTEIYSGVPPEYVDLIVQTCLEELKLTDERSYNIQMESFQVRKVELQAEMKRLDSSVELKRIELEMKKLDLSIK